MSNVVAKLEQLEFPECTKEALHFIVRNLSESHRGIPGRGGSSESLATKVAQEFILDVSRKKGHKNKVPH